MTGDCVRLLARVRVVHLDSRRAACSQKEDGSQGTRVLPRSLRVASEWARLGACLKEGTGWTNPGRQYTAGDSSSSALIG